MQALILVIFFLLDLVSIHIYTQLYAKTNHRFYLFMKFVAMGLAASKIGLLLGMAIK